jgi:hypothetical protein
MFVCQLGSACNAPCQMFGEFEDNELEKYKCNKVSKSGCQLKGILAIY